MTTPPDKSSDKLRAALEAALEELENFVFVDCETQGCTNTAAFDVHWPGRRVRLCMLCSVRAINIAQAMGFSLSVTRMTAETAAN